MELKFKLFHVNDVSAKICRKFMENNYHLQVLTGFFYE